MLWPDHCVQGTAGAALHSDLPLGRFDLIQRKGTRPDVDSYSGFSENWNAAGDRSPTGLAHRISLKFIPFSLTRLFVNCTLGSPVGRSGMKYNRFPTK